MASVRSLSVERGITANTKMTQVTVVTTQPKKEQLLVAPVHGTREWSTGLFACCDDCKALLCTCCCFPCLLCSLSDKINECVLMPFCIPGGLIAMRARLRTLGGIKGSIFNDCLSMTFCEPCAICQLSREMDKMGL